MKVLKTLIEINNINNIIFFSLFIRIIILLFFELPNFGDTQTHKQIGEEIFSGKIVSSAIHMPGYGVYMYLTNLLINSNYGVIFADIILSSTTVYIIYLISKKIFNDENVGKISALIYALYPFSIFYSLSSLNETLYVFLLFLSILNFYNDKYLYGIISIIISIYVKSISIFIGPVILIAFLIFYNHNSLRNICRFLALYLFILIIFMSPWWIHNFKKYNDFVPTNLAYGYHLYSGNNEINKTGGGIGGKDVDHQLILDSFQHDYFKADKVFKAKAYNFIKNNPKEFVDITFKKFVKFWKFYPSANEYSGLKYKIISTISYGFVFILTLFFITFYSRKFLKKIFPLIVTIFFFTFVYSLTIVSLRYRFPIEPILIILSSYSLKKFFLSNYY